MFKKLFFFIAISLVTMSYAYPDSVGNGGDGVFIKKDGTKKPFLLDLIEAGVHSNPYFRDRNNYSNRLKEVLQKRIGVDKNAASLIAAKIKELDEVVPLVGGLLKSILLEMTWSFVEPKLVNFQDHGDTVLAYNELELVQLAARRGFHVTINQTLWNQLDKENRAALILHEGVYALAPHTNIKFIVAGEHIEGVLQLGGPARTIIGHLFTKRYAAHLNALAFERLLWRVGYRLLKISGSPLWISKKRAIYYDYHTFYYREKYRDKYCGVQLTDGELKIPQLKQKGIIEITKINSPKLRKDGSAHTGECYKREDIMKEVESYSPNWLPSF